ncbi:MAG: hypothetical protein KA752_04480 [Giesbergeria sp.]|nr:hypothetical protein [Giesbergeria sp.]
MLAINPEEAHLGATPACSNRAHRGKSAEKGPGADRQKIQRECMFCACTAKIKPGAQPLHGSPRLKKYKNTTVLAFESLASRHQKKRAA